MMNNYFFCFIEIMIYSNNSLIILYLILIPLHSKLLSCWCHTRYLLSNFLCVFFPSSVGPQQCASFFFFLPLCLNSSNTPCPHVLCSFFPAAVTGSHVVLIQSGERRFRKQSKKRWSGFNHSVLYANNCERARQGEKKGLKYIIRVDISQTVSISRCVNTAVTAAPDHLLPCQGPDRPSGTHDANAANRRYEFKVPLITCWCSVT